MVEVILGGEAVRALVDTGCSTALVNARLVDHCEGEGFMTAFDGRNVKCRGVSWVQLEVAGKPLKVCAVVLDNIVNNLDLVIGMEVIDQLGGVLVDGNKIQFGVGQCSVASATKNEVKDGDVGGDENVLCRIEDKDFTAKFDGNCWTAEWSWKDNQPPKLQNTVSCYDRQLSGRKRERFEKEVERWIEEGILLPWNEEVESGILPLMAVEQPTKDKVRPVLDYRELNKYIQCHTGDDVIDVCTETLREWRQVEGETVLVDLKSAYLQVRVAKELWKYQLVKHKGRTYCLTRLGFGLNSAPRIMTKILKTVLSKSEKIREATSSYIDDILVDTSRVSAAELIHHLNRYGLATKSPEPLDGGVALGLKIKRNRMGELSFGRGNELPDVSRCLTRRELFSVCGKLVGHYPIAGWLRVACSYIKRKAEGTRWDDYVGERAMVMMGEVMERVKKEDPVKGRWTVPKRGDAVVWCDASSIAMGVLLEVDGQGVEDAAWLRKKDDCSHINVAELEAVLKGINMALKWGLKDISLLTDSVTVRGWVRVTLMGEKRIRTKGAAEMIVKRRLGTLRNLIDEFGLRVTVSYVSTSKNKADVLTRVKKDWLRSDADDPREENQRSVPVCAGAIDLEEVHNMHHFGVDRTLFLARKIDPAVTRNSVQNVVRSCMRCQAIDPAPVVHEKGEIEVTDNWRRLAIDVTHYRQMSYLSVVDCGPGRFAVWKELRKESADCVVALLNEIFFERGPAEEILVDNATVFRSETMKEFLEGWKVQPYFRAAYRPSGNGIVERHHRTIKAIAERGRISPLEAVFWYNMAPRFGQREDSIPQRAIFRYDWRHPSVDPQPNEGEATGTGVELGDEVWVKPPGARCTSHWQRGVVTRLNSNSNVSVDGMPRHILDVRRVVHPSRDSVGHEQEESADVATRDEELVESETEGRYPQRRRQPPCWMSDYVTDDVEHSLEL